jgi:2-iminobutanoate/2-iminopropanoate deaminase
MAKREVIAGKPGSPYSTAIKANGFLFVSGTVSVGTDGKPVTGNIEVQARQTLENLKRVVESQGASLNDTVKVTVYLTDVKDFEAMNKVYKTFFPTDPPARTTVGVKELARPGFIIEVDLIVAL